MTRFSTPAVKPLFLWAGAFAVLVWRIVAYLSPEEGPDGWLRLALGGLGLLFVACGLVASRNSGGAPRLFALYALCSGLHWGGPIGSSNLSENPWLLGGYVVVSSILGEALFLHFTFELVGLRPSRWRRWIVRALYAPAVVGALQVPAVALVGRLPGPGELATTALLVAYGFAGTFSYVALAVLVVRGLRSKARVRSAWVLGGLVVGGLPALLHDAGLFPGPADAYNLVYGLTPLAVVVGLRRRERQEDRDSVVRADRP